MRNNPAFKITGMLVCIVLLVLGIYFLNRWQFSKNYAWINLNKVYNEFSLKKDLELKFKATEGERKKIIDSLGLDLELLSNQLQAIKEKNSDAISNFQAKKQDYFKKKQELEEDNERLKADYNSQVLTQINQYVKDYALAHDIAVILGADGTGAVMYAKENLELTDDILVFINNKYKGIK